MFLSVLGRGWPVNHLPLLLPLGFGLWPFLALGWIKKQLISKKYLNIQHKCYSIV